MSETKGVALITGAARGIGLATARRFLREDYQVGLLDNDSDTLEQAASQLDKHFELAETVAFKSFAQDLL